MNRLNLYHRFDYPEVDNLHLPDYTISAPHALRCRLNRPCNKYACYKSPKHTSHTSASVSHCLCLLTPVKYFKQRDFNPQSIPCQAALLLITNLIHIIFPEIYHEVRKLTLNRFHRNFMPHFIA